MTDEQLQHLATLDALPESEAASKVGVGINAVRMGRRINAQRRKIRKRPTREDEIRAHVAKWRRAGEHPSRFVGWLCALGVDRELAECIVYDRKPGTPKPEPKPKLRLNDAHPPGVSPKWGPVITTDWVTLEQLSEAAGYRVRRESLETWARHGCVEILNATDPPEYRLTEKGVYALETGHPLLKRGEQFGELTVLTSGRRKNGEGVRCRCSCGRIHDTSAWALRTGKSTRCRHCETSERRANSTGWHEAKTEGEA